MTVHFSIFIIAGTDTTSNALARILQLLAEHQDIQDKVREELFNAGSDGADIPYDQLMDLPYLDAICRETLRLYVSIPLINIAVLHNLFDPATRQPLPSCACKCSS